MQQQAMQSLTDQAGQLAGAPMLDPSKAVSPVEGAQVAAEQAQQPPE